MVKEERYMITIALNGFGRIGKTFLRTVLEDENARRMLKVAVINLGKGDPRAAALAFKYDSVMGTYKDEVYVEQNKLHIGDLAIPLISELDPEKAPWKAYNIDWVVEATGHFSTGEGARKHLHAGAKAVLITAPAKGEDVTIVPGVNSEAFNPQKDKIVSLGSCTTNAWFTMMKVLDDAFGLKEVFMTTVHAYTNTQALLDVDPDMKDPRRGRAAPLNIVPTTTGAMEVIGKIFPHLAKNVIAVSLRVPVPKVSLIDLTATLKKAATAQEINDTFKAAAQGRLKGIIGFTIEPLVSSDYSGNNNSATIDGLMTTAQGTTAKVFGWYDNEWGYSERLKDFLVTVAK